MTAHRCAGGLKKFDLWLGSQRHRHFVGFFNVPFQAPTRNQHSLRIQLFRKTAPYQAPFTTHMGIRRTSQGVSLDESPVIYVTGHRCAGGLNKKFCLPSGCHSRGRHSIALLSVNVQAHTGIFKGCGYSSRLWLQFLKDVATVKNGRFAREFHN